MHNMHGMWHNVGALKHVPGINSRCSALHKYELQWLKWTFLQDYINIELDNQRNQLIRVSDNSVAGFANLLTASDVHLNVHCWLQIELVLTAATFAVAIIGSIAGIFGMNLNNNHEDSHTLFLVVRKCFLCVVCVEHLFILGVNAWSPWHIWMDCKLTILALFEWCCYLMLANWMCLQAEAKLYVLQVTVVSVLGALLVFAAIIAYCRHKKLIAWCSQAAVDKNAHGRKQTYLARFVCQRPWECLSLSS